MKIWSNATLSQEATDLLIEATKSHELVLSSATSSNLGFAGPSEDFIGCDIAFGQPDPQQVMESDSVKWVHITSAGYTRYDTRKFFGCLREKGVAFTNSSTVYDEPCAEHALSFILSHCRQLPLSFSRDEWDHSGIRPKTVMLRGQTVLLLGYGAIATRLARMLEPFGAQVIAMRRVIRGDEIVPTKPISELLSYLPLADHVINILPANDSTEGIISAEALAAMKPTAAFHNIGRGSTVDQGALIEHLQSGRLAAAYLDVTDPEPLPRDHPLWKAPNCFITPHTAGGRHDQDAALVDHFLENLRAFENDGVPSVDLVW